MWTLGREIFAQGMLNVFLPKLSPPLKPFLFKAMEILRFGITRRGWQKSHHRSVAMS